MDYGKGPGTVNAAPPTSFRTYVSALEGPWRFQWKTSEGRIPQEQVQFGSGKQVGKKNWRQEDRLKQFIHSAGVKRIERVWMKLKGVDSANVKSDQECSYKYTP